ncbi:hypothetical protein GM415_04730 [Pseudodesulfovibrio cashew]|uniref:O-antigen ligase domain-containing protein n=1 Tax=Pseudodesulfovibrio cashew TaxID=2678688 RepID=A0A6I6JG14_9BACT|nr:hypothetical protein [Pseudodesulfovibrio cashew]QGY39453.1 hypothetical protein GM415_04730 [Pseudodesulfovibrio cashew]
MSSTKSATWARGGLTAVPLAVAYGAVPLGTAIMRGLLGDFADLPIYIPWLLLAGLGTLAALRGKGGSTPFGVKFLFQGMLFLLLCTGLMVYAADITAALSPLLPYLHESAPAVILLFCLLWAGTFGLPDRADFQRFGALLSLVCIIDFAVEVFAYQTVPTVRWIGNADVLSGLLVVALCASLKPGGNQGGCHEPDQGKAAWRAMILIALLTCLSRTGLFAAAWAVLCFGRGKARYRLLYALTCAVLIFVSFLLPPTASDAIRYADYWLWVESLRLFSENSALLLTGLPVTDPLPLAFPPGMSAIWQAATGQSPLFGAYLPQVPSFWLRLTLGWGMLAPVGLLTVVFILLFRRLTRMGAGLVAGLFAQGMTTPLLYDPATAAAITFGFLLALSVPRERSAAAPEAVAPAPPVEAGSTDEWNLRPL